MLPSVAEPSPLQVNVVADVGHRDLDGNVFDDLSFSWAVATDLAALDLSSQSLGSMMGQVLSLNRSKKKTSSSFQSHLASQPAGEACSARYPGLLLALE